MGKNRSRDAETESVNRRMLRRGAVKRQHINRWAVGADEIGPGQVGSDQLGHQAVREVNIDPALIMRETIPFDQIDDLVTEVESHSMPVRIGGRPVIVAQVREDSDVTADIEVTVYKNGVSFGTITIPIGELQAWTSFDTIFRRFDTCRTDCTDAGAGGIGLSVTWWFE